MKITHAFGTGFGGALPPGEITVMPRRPREEMTTLEIAEEAVEDAYSDLQCAMVKLEGARERFKIILAHEKWKALETSSK